MSTGTAIVRPAQTGDLSHLCALMPYIDPGIVTLPRTRQDMAQRIEASQAAFAAKASEAQSHDYFLVMEEEGQIIGASTLYTKLGSETPFYNYRISRLSQESANMGKRQQDLHLLNLVTDCHGRTELSDLFLWPRARGQGRGRLLSLARLMLISIDPPRFGQQVCSEIRGWTDANGLSPFWEALGRKFFAIESGIENRLSARDPRFIAAAMPPHPVYVELLPDLAQKTISKCHPSAAPARTLLENQGFRFGSLINMFDGGPCLEAYTENLNIIRQTERRRARVWAGADPALGFISTSQIERFAATSVSVDTHRDCALQRIGSTAEDEILFCRYHPDRIHRPHS